MKHERQSRSALLLSVLLLVGMTAAAQKPAGKPSARATAACIERIENGFRPVEQKGEAPIRMTLTDWMKLLNVPGISVAVFDDFQIAWSKSYGVVEAGRTQPVTAHTLFQAGSISKPVTATTTMYYVQRGQLSLDENVNSRLATWKVPDNEFTAREKVTLRRLMSHSAGLTVHGFPGYAIHEPVPTLVQIFNGEKPANTAPIRVDITPGTRFRYSGGGTTVMQQLLVDVFHKPFPQLVRETVLDKIGMRESTYEQPLPAARAALAATGHRWNGKPVEGKWHIYPEMAAAGLWTTPADLARFAIEIAKAWNGQSKLLSRETAHAMLTPQIEQVLLGFFSSKENPRQFGHGGSDAGFQALLVAFADTGQGAAIMTNSDNGGRVAEMLVANIAREYGWKYPVPKPAIAEVMSPLILMKGVDAAITQYRIIRRDTPDAYQFDENQLNSIGYELLSTQQVSSALKIFELNVEMYPEAWNPWDSLGEAHMTAGNKERAIQCYEKSLALNPKNENAQKMLAKLRG